jgi:tRNA modification GTPase
MINNDTIASISTAPGFGAIGIVRISGLDAFNIASRIFMSKNKDFDKIESHSVTYGNIIDPEIGKTIDEVLLIKMKGPRTYTMEDVVEINCHGGLVVVRKVLDIVCKFGARVAEPGEFTKRAFLNGRIDLSQAEAVIDIINSRADESLKASMDQLEGQLSKRIRSVRQKIISVLAHIEALVDYPEYDIEEISRENVYNKSIEIRKDIIRISESFNKGRIIKEGLNIVIVGRPNVGKSSLLNIISGRDRAIVTDIPGTTRDAIEEFVDFSGIPANLIDTAGLRETDDYVENIGVERVQKYIEKSDLILFMLDGCEGITADDIKILDKIKSKKFVVIINKIDNARDEVIKNIRNYFNNEYIIETSIIRDLGIEDIEKYIKENFSIGDLSINNEVLITNIRHKRLIDEALTTIDGVLNAVESGMPLDIISIDLKNAAENLGNITGDSVSEDVLKEIFSRFCIGK